MKFVVIGAGLGGLTAAIALRQQGFDVEVCEAAERIAEVGAGLTLGRGAQHVFRALGIQSKVAAMACPASTLPFVHYRTAKLVLGALDNGDGLPDDGESDIVRHCYRADLQAVLRAELEELGVAVRTGNRLTRIVQDDQSVIAHFANGGAAEADILAAADGVRSAARALLWPGDAPRFTDHVAYRFLVPADDAAPFMSLGRSAIFIGPQRSFNRYTMAGGRVVNCAGLVETGDAVPEGWSIAATKEEILCAFADWHPDVLGLIERATSSIKWGLYDRAPIDQWSQGRVVLLGDAAHAMLPFLGMGAAMAIEDGYVLARAFALETDIAAALARFQAARKPRTELVHRSSIEQGRITQALDPERIDAANIPMGNQEMMAFNPVDAGI